MKCYLCGGKPRRLRVFTRRRTLPVCDPCARIVGHQWRTTMKPKPVAAEVRK